MHYRDFMLRELCYDQDLFILQTAMVILDPNSVIVTMLDRFQLAGYFSGATLHHVYDNTQMANMVEEFLYVLITVMTETANATKMPLPQSVRREIVHALALGPCTYTELVKRVAERKSDDVCFDRVLNDVANFKAPDSTADSGMYELKDEAFDEVNPFFYHHTRNKREEVEVVLKTHLKKRSGAEDPVLVPKPLSITRGPFTVLSSVLESEVLLQLIFYGIFNVISITDATNSAPPSAEAILDQCLHLLMLALVERPQSFSYISVNKIFEENQTLLDVVCALERNTTYHKNYKSRVQWILSQFELYQPQEVQARKAPEPSVQVDPEEAKKRAAKARQEALMKQMKAQQASFANQFEDLEDEDEEEDMEHADAPVSYGTCIVCQEELNNTRGWGALALIQPSRFLRRYPETQQGHMNDVLSAPENMDRPSVDPIDSSFPPVNAEAEARTVSLEGFPPQSTRFGLHASICTHLMHLECFVVYNVSIRQRHRTQTTRNHPESIPRKEYICPLCKSLGNAIIPVVTTPNKTELNTVPFPDWIRAAGISILKSKPDPLLDSLQSRNGTGEFVFWGAMDPAYSQFVRPYDKDLPPVLKMVDSIMAVVKTVSSQTRHLRDRPEPEMGERGAGMYLPEELVGYTVACLEVAQRGTGAPGSTVADTLTESQSKMIQGLVISLTQLAALHFKGRPDEGRDAVKQAIIKRLLPEWSRSSFTSYSYPLLLRDPFTILVETASVAPEIIKHVLVLTYYACLARTVVGLLYILNKTRTVPPATPPPRQYEDIFGDIRMFFMSVIRPSPVFEHAAEVAFQAFGDARIEKLMYAFTLPFLRRAAILCRAVLPSAFPSPSMDDACEYRRLLRMLDIPPLSDLPNQDTLQNALSGWCAHYGHSPAASQLNCGVVLDFPLVYQIVKLPLILDTLFLEQDKTMICPQCKTVPQDAAICLLCGTAVCFQSHCCVDHENQGKGECNMHMRE